MPYEDHFPKAYIKRDGFLLPEAADLLVGKGTTELGQIRPSIWLDGEVIGRWEIERPAKGSQARVVIKGLVKRLPCSKDIRTGIEEERKSIEIFLNCKLLPLCGTKEET